MTGFSGDGGALLCFDVSRNRNACQENLVWLAEVRLDSQKTQGLLEIINIYLLESDIYLESDMAGR